VHEIQTDPSALSADVPRKIAHRVEIASSETGGISKIMLGALFVAAIPVGECRRRLF